MDSIAASKVYKEKTACGGNDLKEKQRFVVIPDIWAMKLEHSYDAGRWAERRTPVAHPCLRGRGRKNRQSGENGWDT